MSDKNTLMQTNKKIGVKLNVLLNIYENRTKIDKPNVVSP